MTCTAAGLQPWSLLQAQPLPQSSGEMYQYKCPCEIQDNWHYSEVSLLQRVAMRPVKDMSMRQLNDDRKERVKQLSSQQNYFNCYFPQSFSPNS